VGKSEGTKNRRGTAVNGNNCSQVSLQCAPESLFIRVVTGGHYNVCNTLFTYPNLSLYSHRIITVLRDLQIFLCPTNEDATRVHIATSSTEGGGLWLTDDLCLFSTLRPPVPG
jgi:hypothetical protein